MKKSILSVLLVFMLLLSSCAAPAAGGAGETSTGKAWTSAGGAFRQTYLPVSEDCCLLLPDGADLYEVTRSFNPSEADKTEVLRNHTALLYSRENETVLGGDLSDEGLWLVTMSLEDGEYEEWLKLLSYSGTVERSLRTSEIPGFQDGIWRLRCAQGLLYLQTVDGIAEIGSGGEQLAFHELPHAYSDLVIGGDDAPYVTLQGEDGLALHRLGDGAEEPLFILPGTEARVFGGDEAHFLLMTDGEGLFSLEADGTAAPILIWRDCGLTPIDVRRVFALPNGEYLL